MGGFINDLTGVGREKEQAGEQVAGRERGLGELTPEKLTELINLFQTGLFQSLSSQIGGAQGAIRGIGGRKGAQGSGVLQQLQAGVPGQLASSAQRQAIPLGVSVGKERAGIASAVTTTPRSTTGGIFDTAGAIASK